MTTETEAEKIAREAREDEELERSGIIQSESQVFALAREFFGQYSRGEKSNLRDKGEAA